MPPPSRSVSLPGRWAEVMGDQRSPSGPEVCDASRREDGCGDEAVVRASLDGALEDLIRVAVEAGPEPYGVSCTRIDRAIDRRIAAHVGLPWARARAEALRHQLKAGLRGRGEANP